jgi:hypothetical protein
LVVYRPDGTLETSFSIDEAGLGIKNVTWSPMSQFLAIGSYDHQASGEKLCEDSIFYDILTFSTAAAVRCC